MIGPGANSASFSERTPTGNLEGDPVRLLCVRRDGNDGGRMGCVRKEVSEGEVHFLYTLSKCVM